MEIYIDVLKAVGEGRRKPTQIMYRSNLTWNRLKKNLSFLKQKELLSEEFAGCSILYYLTESGKKVIEYQKEIELEFYRKTKPNRKGLEPTKRSISIQ